MKVCECCDVKAVVITPIMNSRSGSQEVCLNCGWFITADYLDDEELENNRNNWVEEIDELKEKGIKLEVIE